MLRHSKLKCLPAACLAIALSASASAAQDKALPLPGSTDMRSAASSEVGKQTAEDLACGPVTLNTLRSQNAASSTRSTGFVNIPGAASRVSIGGERCIKVLFTSETQCRQSSATDLCYVRALINGFPMAPEDSFRTFDSENSTGAGHAYEWFDVVPQGTYTIQIQFRVNNTATTFVVDDWVIDTQVLN
jgi:hypothetical protein